MRGGGGRDHRPKDLVPPSPLVHTPDVALVAEVLEVGEEVKEMVVDAASPVGLNVDCVSVVPLPGRGRVVDDEDLLEVVTSSLHLLHIFDYDTLQEENLSTSSLQE